MSCGILSLTQLRRLAEHQYSAEGMSLVEPVMQKYWRWLVEQIPRSWAPNTLTMVGLVLNITTAMIVILQSLDFKQEVSSWAYLLAGLGMFIYQSLDAIDGKQARRTNSATPLGELFDHGCDAVSTVFVSLSTSAAMMLGNHPYWLFAQVFSILFLFYLAHWQAYVSGTLKFKIIDVTELQLVVIACFLLNVIVGDHFWMYQIFGIELNKYWCCAVICCGLIMGSSNIFLIFMRGGSGKNRSTSADTSTVFPLFPSAGVVVAAMVIAWKSPTMLYHQHPALYLLSFGFVFAKITNSLVVAHMTKSEIALWNSIYLGPAMLFLNQYFNCIIDEHFLLWICFLYCFYDITMYCWRVCSQICDYLNIYCFTITSRPRPISTSRAPSS